jgi:hypothetical protein
MKQSSELPLGFLKYSKSFTWFNRNVCIFKILWHHQQDFGKVIVHFHADRERFEKVQHGEILIVDNSTISFSCTHVSHPLDHYFHWYEPKVLQRAKDNNYNSHVIINLVWFPAHMICNISDDRPLGLWLLPKSKKMKQCNLRWAIFDPHSITKCIIGQGNILTSLMGLGFRVLAYLPGCLRTGLMNFCYRVQRSNLPGWWLKKEAEIEV